MNLRNHLRAAGATLAAGALALVPAAQATTPGTAVNHVKVGAWATHNHPITGTFKAGGSVTMKVFGSNKTLNCYSGTTNGAVHAGSPAGAHYKAASFSTLTMNCDSLIPGQTVVISVPTNACAGFWVNDPLKPSVNVHDGLVDTGAKGGTYENVHGAIRVPYNTNAALDCSVTVVMTGGCTIKLGDAILAQFDEAIKPHGSQDLALEGNALRIKSMAGPCLGAYNVNDPITMNNIRFNIASPDGPIDFRTNP